MTSIRKLKGIPLIKLLKEKEKWVEHVTFSPSERYIATCSADNIAVWNLKTALQEASFRHQDAVWKSQFSHNETKLYSVSSDGCLYCWNIEKHVNSFHIKLHTDCVFGLAIHPESSLIATCSADYTIKCFDEVSQEVISTLKGHSMSVEDVCFSPSGEQLVSCSKDTTVLLWDNYMEENNLRAYSLIGHTNWVYMCTFSPDGTILASTSSDKTIGIWSTKKPQLIRFLKGHTNVIWSCSFLHSQTQLSNKYLMSCSSDKTLRIWDIEKGRCVMIQKNVGGVTDGTAQLLCCCFAPLSRLIAVATYHGITYIGKVPMDYCQ